MKTVYVQRINRSIRPLSIDECILYTMLSRVKGTNAWANIIQDILGKKNNNEEFRELIRQLYEQISDGRGSRKTMVTIIGERAVNKIVAICKPY